MSLRRIFNLENLLVILFLVMLFTNTAFAESSLSNGILEKINNAVFEVVVQKPVSDSLTYEHYLPMQLIPYSIRTDKYYSIGTAFAIGPTEFITAAHVMNLGTESQFKEICIRDKDGKVFEIDKITKYSEQRDFAVFTLKAKSANAFFEINTTPRINQKVFAVGNALGEGIVIRDGLYTSSTPEEEEGKWKWIRFSAAASPGNSGGPLLDTEGKVIGIVLQKSPNENLNIALPITEVINAKKNLAIAHRISKYSLEIMQNAAQATFNKEITLPKSYQDLNWELIEGLNLFTYKTIKDLFSSKKNSIFPNGKGSNIILHSSYDTSFPVLIASQTADKNWNGSYPTEIKEAELSNNGRIRYGTIGNTVFIYVKKPDNIALKTLCSDSKMFMDLVLRGMTLTRPIGPEKVRITSLGKMSDSDVFTDSYGRKWLIRCWKLEYNDEKVVTFSLPVPGGFITLMREGQTGHGNTEHIPDLKILSNFIYFTYKGTLKNWRDFLQMKELLPPGFAELDISFDYNKFLHFESKRLSFTINPEFIKIAENSVLQISFDYFKENNKTIWDVGRISVGEDRDTTTFIKVRRMNKPSEDLNSTYQADWENSVSKKFPYNSTTFIDDKTTLIATTLNIPSKEPSNALFTVTYGQDGKVEQAEMMGKMGYFLQHLTIYDFDERKNVQRDSYHDKSDYFQALWDFERIPEMQARTADGYILRGIVYKDKGDLEKAMANFDKAIEMNPENAGGYFYRGISYQDRGKTELALADFNKAVELDPINEEAYFHKGNIYRGLSNHDDAIANFSKAIEIKPEDIASYINRGISYGTKGKLDLAMTDFNRALELDSNNADAYNNRGFTYKVQGDLVRALADFDQSIESNPNYSLAYINRGNTYAVMKDKTKACSDWEKACEQGSCTNFLNAKKKRYCE